MNMKIFFKAASAKAAQSLSSGRKIAKSYIALFLVVVLSVTASLAWFSEHRSARISTNGLQFQSASSLRINKDQSTYNTISIPEFTLDEASSVDGKNIYFPLGESFNTTTSEMNFREANMGDRNVHYVYHDFFLKGSSGETEVYIKSYKITVADADGDTDASNDSVNGVYQDEMEIKHDASTGKIPEEQIIPPDDCPIRLSFIADSAYTSKIIDPSAQVKDYAENSDAVAIIDDKGVPTLKRTNNDSFASFYYGNSPLFTILPDQNLDVTLVIWLEGTMGNSDKYIGKKITVDIDIESNFAEMEEIKFVDDTKADDGSTDVNKQHWISNDDPIIACSYKDPYSEEDRWKTVIMTESKLEERTWVAQIPKKAISDIVFYRLSKPAVKASEPHGTIFNAWYTSEDKASKLTNSSIHAEWYSSGAEDLQTSRQMPDNDGVRYNETVYTAVHGNGLGITTGSGRLAACVGYWGYSGGGSSGGGDTTPTSSGGGDTPSGNNKIYIKVDVRNADNNNSWQSVVRVRVNAGDDFYVKTSDPNHSTVNLDYHSNDNYFDTTINLATGVNITGFAWRSHLNSGEYEAVTPATFTVGSSDYNVIYTYKDTNDLTKNQ